MQRDAFLGLFMMFYPTLVFRFMVVYGFYIVKGFYVELLTIFPMYCRCLTTLVCLVAVDGITSS